MLQGKRDAVVTTDTHFVRHKGASPKVQLSKERVQKPGFNRE
jgi:hypothetical protein